MERQKEEPVKKSFLREWGSLIAFGMFAVTVLIGFRLWTEHQENQPVADAYRDYLAHLASRSKGANEYLEGYYAKHARRSVASRHFESVCATMTRLADGEGVHPEEFSSHMARACRTFLDGGITGDPP